MFHRLERKFRWSERMFHRLEYTFHGMELMFQRLELTFCRIEDKTCAVIAPDFPPASIGLCPETRVLM